MRMSRRLVSARVACFKYTYSGLSEFTGKPEGDWELIIKSEGTLNVQSLPKGRTLDVFLVGGGGGGAGSIYDHAGTSYHALARGGGGGGETRTATIAVVVNQDYHISIGQGGAAGTGGNSFDAVAGGDGGTTVFDNLTAPGGSGAPGTQYGGKGGSGGGGIENYGAGGDGGSDGSDGGSSYPGTGQHTTTRKFEEPTGTLYAGGGGSGGHPWGNYSTGGAGGDNSGGHGGPTATKGSDGKPNTGGGGGGAGGNTAGANAWAGSWNGGTGGSGIVIIRNHKT